MKKQFYRSLCLCFVCFITTSCANGEIISSKLSQETQSPVDAIIAQNIRQAEDSEASPNRSSAPQMFQMTEESEKLLESASQFTGETATQSESVLQISEEATKTTAQTEFAPQISEEATEITEVTAQTESTPQIMEEETSATESVSPRTDEVEVGHSETNKIDVDLTVLSSTMVYAEVYNIMMYPEYYVGKTIKGSGIYNCFYYEEIDRYFHYFVISDATGCCPQGLDFMRNGAYKYPDDYPAIGEDIEVTGVFVKGEIDGQAYYHLAVDKISTISVH